jgi:hypothetical protein
MKRIWLLAFTLALPVPLGAAEPPVVLQTGPRHGHATPERTGCTHTAGGNILVAQPTPDVLQITLTGVAVATGHPFGGSQAAMNFDVNQEIKIVFNDPKLTKCKLYLDCRVTGVLRGDSSCFGQTGSHGKACAKGCGSAQQGQACVAVTAGGQSITSLCVDPHSVTCGEFLSLNCAAGPCGLWVTSGCYSVHETFNISVMHPRSLWPCKPASAEFAPDALDPLWISYWEPFRGISKKDFGFVVTIRVAPE